MTHKTSWIPVPPASDFPIQNLPYGIFSVAGDSLRAGVRIGDHILDLAACAAAGYFDGILPDIGVFARPVLNDFAGSEKSVTAAVRQKITEILAAGSVFQTKIEAGKFLFSVKEAQMHLPLHIGDYTDFYSSIEHATNVGIMFRGVDNALMPNWKHLPVGYHGRSSSIVVSGTPVRRPKGQTKADNAELPTFGPSRLMDFELEMAYAVGRGNAQGKSISAEDAEDHIFGFMIFNDWSARDIQKWEYVPLGPFLSKNFSSSLSPWVVTLEALEPFRVAGPEQDPAVLPYLQTSGKRNFDINLEVIIQTENGDENTVCESNFKYMYWNPAQQIAHHTCGGCNLRTGDLYASGTISGKDETSYGSMLELTWRGEKPLKMKDGSERKFLLDGDTVIIRAYSEKDGLRIGFGEVSGKILPAD